jgi:membrane protein implicated in regulation of membrane protease activity
MFGKSKRTAATTPTAQTDQYRLKATGRRVTVLEHLSGGEVRIAMDNGRITRDDIVSARDITPA